MAVSQAEKEARSEPGRGRGKRAEVWAKTATEERGAVVAAAAAPAAAPPVHFDM